MLHSGSLNGSAQENKGSPMSTGKSFAAFAPVPHAAPESKASAGFFGKQTVCVATEGATSVRSCACIIVCAKALWLTNALIAALPGYCASNPANCDGNGASEPPATVAF